MTKLIAMGSGGMKPSTPTIGTASDGGTGTTASVAFTPSTYIGKGTITYTATSSPGGLTGSASSSPITVTGLTTGQAYTFTVVGTTNYGVSSDASAASNSVTPAIPSSPNFESIASVTFSTSAGPFEFTNIPQTYKTLLIIMYAKASNGTGSDMMESFIKINNVNSAIYNQLGGIYFTGISAGTNYGSTNQTDAWIDKSMSRISAQNAAYSYIYLTDYKNSSKKPTTLHWAGSAFGNASNQWSVMSNSIHMNSQQATSRITITFQNNASASYGMSLFGMKGA